MSNRGHIAEYRQNRTAGAQASDDPHRTITLLLQGAIERIRLAERAMAEGNVAEKLEAIDRALDIVDVLRASLDHEAGGQIAGGLEALYTYISELLVQGNAGNQPAPLAESIKLLGEIVSAWAAISPQPTPAPAPGG